MAKEPNDQESDEDSEDYYSEDYSQDDYSEDDYLGGYVTRVLTSDDSEDDDLAEWIDVDKVREAIANQRQVIADYPEGNTTPEGDAYRKQAKKELRNWIKRLEAAGEEE